MQIMSNNITYINAKEVAAIKTVVSYIITFALKL